MSEDLARQVDQLLTSVSGMGERADRMLSGALTALTDRDAATADVVRDTDPLVDRAYRDVQNGVLTVMALHGPVGRDLRTLTALIHVSLHLERMGDYAKNVARVATLVREYPAEPVLTGRLVEMGELARKVSRKGLHSFVHHDLALASEAVQLDDGVDQFNFGIFHQLVRLAAREDDRFEWAARMIEVTRQLERFADHGVDIAEMTAFVAGSELPPRAAGEQVPGDSRSASGTADAGGESSSGAGPTEGPQRSGPDR